MPAVILEFNNVSWAYPGKENPVLHGVNLAVGYEDRIGLTGGNGQGKSTLLHIACGLLAGYSGEVRFEGKVMRAERDFAAMRLQTGYLLQNSEDQLFCPSVIEDVAFGPFNQGFSDEESEEIAWNTLKKLGIENLAHCGGSRLSGGERKMAALASILAMSPRLLLLDEPGNSLDAKNRERFIATVVDLDLPMLLVSHDSAMLEEICGRIVSLEEIQSAV